MNPSDSFLHDYRWEQDGEFKVLELIMTAPMIVTHWINFQYSASTVDNPHYGSGNLFQIDSAGRGIRAWRRGGWVVG